MPVYLTGSPVNCCCWERWGCMDMASISMSVLIAADIDTDGGSGCE